MAIEKKIVKPKSAVKKTRTAKKTSSKPRAATAKVKTVRAERISEEYAEYLERYAKGTFSEVFGEGRPRLKPSEFDELDDELLDLLAQQLDHGLSDEQSIRLKELEFLLLDSDP